MKGRPSEVLAEDADADTTGETDLSPDVITAVDAVRVDERRICSGRLAPRHDIVDSSW